MQVWPSIRAARLPLRAPMHRLYCIKLAAPLRLQSEETSAEAEVLTVGGAALVRLAERQWGPSVAAPPAAAAAAQRDAGSGADTDGTVAVLREAFSPYAQPQRSLSQVRSAADAYTDRTRMHWARRQSGVVHA